MEQSTSFGIMTQYVGRIMLSLLAGVLLGTSGCDFALSSHDQAASVEGTRPLAEVEFFSGYTTGYDHARKMGKPMLVFFTAQQCHYCEQMLSETFCAESVVQLSEEFVCIQVDADAEADVCKEFGVEGYPTVQFISPRGVPLTRLTGRKDPGPLAVQMRAALEAVAATTPLSDPIVRR